nr:MAG TPA: hypothetical protein [Caudoviricetes sp.]
MPGSNHQNGEGGVMPPWPVTAILAALWIISAIADGFFK